MQAEQQLSTTTSSKKISLKKEKKITKKQEEQDEQVELSTPVQVQVQVPTVTIEATPSPVVEPSIKEIVLQQENNVTQDEKEETIVIQDIDFQSFLEKFNTIQEYLAEINKFLKYNTFTKEERLKYDIYNKKFHKSYSAYNTNLHENLTRNISSLEKNTLHKSSSKKTVNKDSLPIHKKLAVYPFVLEFLKLEPNTLVSRAELLRLINSYVKIYAIEHPEIIDPEDKKSFNLIGDLKNLFDNIEEIAKSRNVVEKNPTKIKYTDIMYFMTYFFIK